jgi:hypothetical protein
MEAKHEAHSLWLGSLNSMIKVVSDECFSQSSLSAQRWETLLEFLDMQTKMNVQEEIDRDSLSLVGMKETKGQVGPCFASLDNTCMTCGKLSAQEK